MIRVDLDVMLARRKMSLTELSQRVGITMANLSILKNGRAKAVRLETLNAICRALGCQPGDILVYEEDAGRKAENDGQWMTLWQKPSSNSPRALLYSSHREVSG